MLDPVTMIDMTARTLAAALLILAACDSVEQHVHDDETAPVLEIARSCQPEDLPDDWGTTPVDVLVHSCEPVDRGIANCCFAARADSGLVAELEVRTAGGVVQWDSADAPDLGTIPTAWASDGSIVQGPITWDVCALPSGDERLAFHLRAEDPDADPAAGHYWTYRIVYVGNGGPACKPPPPAVPSCAPSGCH